MLIPDMLLLLFGYRNYTNRKCPTSFMKHNDSSWVRIAECVKATTEGGGPWNSSSPGLYISVIGAIPSKPMAIYSSHRFVMELL